MAGTSAGILIILKRFLSISLSVPVRLDGLLLDSVQNIFHNLIW